MGILLSSKSPAVGHAVQMIREHPRGNGWHPWLRQAMHQLLQLAHRAEHSHSFTFAAVHAGFQVLHQLLRMSQALQDRIHETALAKVLKTDVLKTDTDGTPWARAGRHNLQAAKGLGAVNVPSVPLFSWWVTLES